MRCLLVIGVLLLAFMAQAGAQIQIAAQTNRSTFLLYEPVDLLVTVQNIGGENLLLSSDDGQPWLSFMVSRHAHGSYVPVRSERDAKFQSLTLKPGETRTLKINLTPLASFREEGEYRASAVINVPGTGQMISEPVPFTVVEGRQVWSQVRSVDDAQRTFSLIRFSPRPDSTKLYLRVENPSENIVYANIALGEIASSSEPDAQFDPAGNLHILQPVAMSTYLYTRADASGQVLRQTIFKSTQMGDVGRIPPRLVKIEDGNVIVVGGLEQNPNAPRERLSAGQGVKQAAAQEPAAAPTSPQ